MSMLEKISIQGIRSFGSQDNHRQVLQFFTPLTLILGPNGTGKTTIIECLRYVTTGDVPPNCSKGATFVHDPKLDGEIEVRGQVRLQCRDVSDKRIAINRSMIVTQKASQLVFKSLEFLISRIGLNGEKITLSAKCADLNNEVSSCLGVSKAVLNSVIFCHQEESNWPLAEGKSVKERFDEIFAATRYIKALENIRNIRKDLTGKIKVFKGEIVFLEQNKEKAKKIQEDLKSTKTRHIASKNRVDEIAVALKPIEEKLVIFGQKEGEIHAIETNVGKEETLLKQLGKNKMELLNMIQNVFTGSEDELKQEIESFKAEVEIKTSLLDEVKRKYRNLEQQSEQIRKQQAKLSLELGKLRTLEQQHNERIKTRETKVLNAAQQLKITEFLSSRDNFSEDKISNFMAELQKKIDTVKEEEQNSKAAYDLKEKELQIKMDGIRDERTQGEQMLKMNKERLNKNKKEIDNIISELRRVDNSALRQQELETTIRQLELELRKIDKALDVPQARNNISSLQKEKYNLDSQLKTINQEMDKLQLESEKRTQLDILEKDKLGKVNIIKKISSRHEDTLNNLLGTVPPQNIHRELDQFSNRLNSEVKVLAAQIVNMKTKMSALETTRRFQMEELKTKENLLSNHQEKIFLVSGSGDFDESMDSLSKSLRELQDEKGALIGSKFIYGKYVEKLGSIEPCCPLCERGFAENQEVEDLIVEIRRKINMIPNQLQTKERVLKDQQKKLNSMLELKPLRDEIKVLTQSTIPKIKQSVKLSNESIDNLRKEITESEDNLESKQIDQASCDSIQPDMVLLNQHQSELTKIEKQLSEIKKKLGDSGNTRSIKEVSKDREMVQTKFQSTMKEVETLQERLASHTEKVNSLQSQVNDKRAELLQITADQQKRQSLNEQKSKFISENSELEVAVQGANKQIKLKDVELQSVKSDKDQLLNAKETALQLIKKQLELLNGHKTDINFYTQEIIRYTRERRQEALQELEKKLGAYNSQIEQKDQEIQTNSETIQKLQEEIANQEVKERELQDNLRLKDCVTSMEKVDKKCKELRVKLGNINTTNLFREKEKLSGEHNTLTKEKLQAEGRMKEIVDKIKHFENELESDLYKDADIKYSDKLIDLRTREHASDDLNKYYKALDTAVMKYHSLKMAEINKIIRELWVTTYKGNDIEYIEIRSDQSDSTSGTDKRRVYHYRVVMICGDTELDMRGRCSAGQKVLASLIIRLALAQTFCLNCGILALDEPTTNLDRDNIESLAFALLEIIKSHAGQTNFQLIVITHDEEFIGLLGRSSYSDYFYKVMKDSSALSRLQKCTMAEMQNA